MDSKRRRWWIARERSQEQAPAAIPQERYSQQRASTSAQDLPSAPHFEPRHRRGHLSLLWLEENPHGVQSAEHYRPQNPGDNQKPEETRHMAKRLLAGYC